MERKDVFEQAGACGEERRDEPKSACGGGDRCASLVSIIKTSKTYKYSVGIITTSKRENVHTIKRLIHDKLLGFKGITPTKT